MAAGDDLHCCRLSSLWEITDTCALDSQIPQGRRNALSLQEKELVTSLYSPKLSPCFMLL